jgi:DNA-directed RNA polymerase specialized sigma24 family protein
MPPDFDGSGYVFRTWRDALVDAQAGIARAYGHRARMFRAAHEAGLSYREIGEATGLSAAAVGKVLGKQDRATLDSPANV